VLPARARAPKKPRAAFYYIVLGAILFFFFTRPSPPRNVSSGLTYGASIVRVDYCCDILVFFFN
jgi:hypothetical protein